MERATIHQGTIHEISWSADDPVTPQLVDRIKDAGDELQLDWLNSEFTPAVELLLEKMGKKELVERIYDEDSEIIETISLIILSPLTHDNTTAKKMTRLYLPVILIIVDELTS